MQSYEQAKKNISKALKDLNKVTNLNEMECILIMYNILDDRFYKQLKRR